MLVLLYSAPGKVLTAVSNTCLHRDTSNLLQSHLLQQQNRILLHFLHMKMIIHLLLKITFSFNVKGYTICDCTILPTGIFQFSYPPFANSVYLIYFESLKEQNCYSKKKTNKTIFWTADSSITSWNLEKSSYLHISSLSSWRSKLVDSLYRLCQLLLHEGLMTVIVWAIL